MGKFNLSLFRFFRLPRPAERPYYGMSRRILAILALSLLGMFVGTRALSGGERLPVADGVPSAKKLPADAAASQVAFETATFGLG